MVKPCARILACLLAVALCGCGTAQSVTSTATEPVPEPVPDTYTSQATTLANTVCKTADKLASNALTATLDSWFHSFAVSRVIPLTIPERAPMSFGPWSAPKDYGASDARDDGALTEWADNYFITHDWSDYGQQILSIVPGDTVTINDRTITIHDIFNYPKDGYFEEVMEVVGKDSVVLQTCFPNSEQNRIAYGS